MSNKYYQVFYSKDIRKKKKVYLEGVLACEDRKTKLFNSEGEIVLNLNQKNSPEIDEEYVLNHTYIGNIIYYVLVLVEK
jgi:hypothetical protein